MALDLIDNKVVSAWRPQVLTQNRIPDPVGLVISYVCLSFQGEIHLGCHRDSVYEEKRVFLFGKGASPYLLPTWPKLHMLDQPRLLSQLVLVNRNQLRVKHVPDCLRTPLFDRRHKTYGRFQSQPSDKLNGKLVSIQNRWNRSCVIPRSRACIVIEPLLTDQYILEDLEWGYLIEWSRPSICNRWSPVLKILLSFYVDADH